MPGLYLHIPFCRKACHYCDFHFSTNISYADQMVNAICTELVLRKSEIKEKINTVYFGGGTPSVLTEKQLHKIFHAIHDSFIIDENAEITLEANPDDLTKENLITFKNIGINRLSIGIQSFRDEDLLWMNRSHDADEAIKSVQLARETGFKNISIDLIYGIPSLSASDWESNLMKAIAMHPEHISAYCLTIEQKTVFGQRLSKGEMKLIDEDNSSEQFLMMRKILGQNGFVQYEVSNFSKPGYQSRHNSSYWEGEKYLGVGPSAHSFDGNSRRWNISNNRVYMKGIEEGLDYFEEEELTEQNKFNEFVMISLRTVQGIDLEKCRLKFGEDSYESLLEGTGKYLESGDLELADGYLRATEKGLLLIDAICTDLFQ